MAPTRQRRPHAPEALYRASWALLGAGLLAAALLQQGCGSGANRYALVETHLQAANPQAAAEVIRENRDEYGSKSEVLYHMDLGMTLHLAGDYEASNTHLEEAERRIEDLYTRRIRTEVAAFLLNDSRLPFEGAPFERVWVNVIKALNYAQLNQWDEALVEARRIDHRLNVLADETADEDDYREDPYARYLSGILYESAGDVNNAFVAYRKAYEAYRAARPWQRTPVPDGLKADLLRTTQALGLLEEHEAYQREFGGVAWRPWREIKDLAQVVVISYNGRAPRTEDQFLDLPISLNALQLVLLAKSAGGSSNTPERRVTESVLYGLNGRVVRVALPKLVPQKSTVTHSEVTLSGPNGSVTTRTELSANLTATAEKALDDRFASLAVKAVARAASKFALAEGAARGAREAGGEDHGALAGLLVGILAKSLAIATEQADTRSWRTLPDEVQIARLWVRPGRYTLRIRPVGVDQAAPVGDATRTLEVQKGQTRIVVERVLS